MNIDKGEIVYCNLTTIEKGKKQDYNEVVYKYVDGNYKGKKVVKLEIIKRLGFANKTEGYHTGVKNKEVRNNITGSYE